MNDRYEVDGGLPEEEVSSDGAAASPEGAALSAGAAAASAGGVLASAGAALASAGAALGSWANAAPVKQATATTGATRSFLFMGVSLLAIWKRRRTQHCPRGRDAAVHQGKINKPGLEMLRISH